jgi:hypothetical protein
MPVFAHLDWGDLYALGCSAMAEVERLLNAYDGLIASLPRWTPDQMVRESFRDSAAWRDRHGILTTASVLLSAATQQQELLDAVNLEFARRRAVKEQQQIEGHT